jgi:hypothetical protein
MKIYYRKCCRILTQVVEETKCMQQILVSVKVSTLENCEGGNRPSFYRISDPVNKDKL